MLDRLRGATSTDLAANVAKSVTDELGGRGAAAARALDTDGLASLVLRPARLEWTATHWDVHFDVHAADLRVRRAGLDIDPGWCEGLGRVVGFHYGLARIGGHGR